jgi:dihydroxyacetone kinase DhaKLM complex PTS-EIIA-like component DhaM
MINVIFSAHQDDQNMVFYDLAYCLLSAENAMGIFYEKQTQWNLSTSREI